MRERGEGERESSTTTTTTNYTKVVKNKEEAANGKAGE